MRIQSFISSAAAALVLCACADATDPASMAYDTSFAFAAPKTTAATSELAGGGGGANLAIQSDQRGAYLNGVDRVVSIIQGDWELDVTNSRTSRRVRIELTDALPGNPSPAPFVAELVRARFISKASNVNGSYTGMVGLGSTMLVPLSVGQIAYGGSTYAIRMNTTHPETDLALVTCTRVTDPYNPATSPCSQWRLTPSAVYDSVSKNVGWLERVGTTTTFLGLYYFTFDITVSR